MLAKVETHVSVHSLKPRMRMTTRPPVPTICTGFFLEHNHLFRVAFIFTPPRRGGVDARAIQRLSRLSNDSAIRTIPSTRG